MVNSVTDKGFMVPQYLIDHLSREKKKFSDTFNTFFINDTLNSFINSYIGVKYKATCYSNGSLPIITEKKGKQIWMTH